LKSRLEELEKQTHAPDFWGDPEKSRTVMKEVKRLKSIVEPWEKISKEIEDAIALGQLLVEAGEDEGDDARQLVQEAEELQRRAHDLEFRSMMSEEADLSNCFVNIHPGAGGTESQDWAQMLLRMYLRWAERHGYEVRELDFSEGDVAGIKNATIQVIGDYAYGYLKAETGIHRLVRISPFDANSRRHTSFASVYVSPEVDESFEVEINEKDIRLDSFRAGGHGGQKVNKTTSAVRITHFPTGIVVACQNERSWHQNRALAFQVLRSRLYDYEMNKRRAELQKVEDQKADINFGSQIRSYVLHPYQLVKDLRTDTETSNTQAVLDGDIDDFIEAWLKQQMKGQKTAKS
jgi:peptide chain release factor 2